MINHLKDKFFWRYFLFAVFFVVVITCVRRCPKEAQAKPIPVSISEVSELGKITEKKVYEIAVSENSYYLIDTRFSLCFYVVYSVNGLSVVDIPCYKFEETIEGMK